MHLGIALLERAEQVFVVLDAQVGMQPALKENAGAAEREHFVNLLVDGFEREQIAFLRTEGTVKGAKRAVLGAEIGVVDVAVNLIRGDARVGLLLADLVGGHADPQQVIALEHFESLLLRDAHRFQSPRIAPKATTPDCILLRSYVAARAP